MQQDLMRAALRVLALSSTLAAFVVIGGGHWAVFQTVAWTRMVVDYTRDSGSLRQGLANTFDGAHPCELCRKISAGVEKERRDDRQKPSKDDLLGKAKLTAVLPIAFSAPFAQDSVQVAMLADFSAGRMADAPPVPPPRCG